MIDKKEIKRKYKDTVQPMGIYQIKNNVNGKIFIGSSPNLKGKFNSFMFQLKMGSHMNRLLQEDFNKYKEEAFSFEVLDYLPPVEDAAYNYSKDLETLEELWLEKLQPYDERGYNSKKIPKKF
jgi:group I intron endonuclease